MGGQRKKKKGHKSHGESPSESKPFSGRSQSGAPWWKDFQTGALWLGFWLLMCLLPPTHDDHDRHHRRHTLKQEATEAGWALSYMLLGRTGYALVGVAGAGYFWMTAAMRKRP
jgi:hypothetical protein